MKLVCEMTLAAIKKMTSRLTKAQKMKLAGDLLEEIVPKFREPVTLAELESRANDVASGRVKAVSGKVFDADLDEMEKSIGTQRRLAHRG